MFRRSCLSPLSVSRSAVSLPLPNQIPLPLNNFPPTFSIPVRTYQLWNEFFSKSKPPNNTVKEFRRWLHKSAMGDHDHIFLLCHNVSPCPCFQVGDLNFSVHLVTLLRTKEERGPAYSCGWRFPLIGLHNMSGCNSLAKTYSNRPCSFRAMCLLE